MADVRLKGRSIAATALLCVLASGCVSAPLSVGAAPEVQRTAAVRHIVERGETVSGLAARYGVSQDDVIDANLLEPPYVLAIGQVLIVPPPRMLAGAHEVRPGDTLSSIARERSVALAELLRANPEIDPHRLLPGQLVRMPGAVVASAAKPAPMLARAAPVRRPRDRKLEPAPRARVATASFAVEQPSARAAVSEPPPRSGEGFLWPVEGRIVARFGRSAEHDLRNDGIELAAPMGEPIYAADHGLVGFAGELGDFGRTVILLHDDGWATTYTYASSLHVERGDVVRRGEMIARVGDSGAAKRPLLHFEVRRGGEALDPERALERPEMAVAQR